MLNLVTISSDVVIFIYLRKIIMGQQSPNGVNMHFKNSINCNPFESALGININYVPINIHNFFPTGDMILSHFSGSLINMNPLGTFSHQRGQTFLSSSNHKYSTKHKQFSIGFVIPPRKRWLLTMLISVSREKAMSQKFFMLVFDNMQFDSFERRMILSVLQWSKYSWKTPF